MGTEGGGGGERVREREKTLLGIDMRKKASVRTGARNINVTKSNGNERFLVTISGSNVRVSGVPHS